MTGHSIRQLALFPEPPPTGDDQQLATVLGGRVPVAVEVLAEITEHRYALLDNTEHVMRFVEDDRVRHALDVEGIITVLIRHGYATMATATDAVTVAHGDISRVVYPVRLTTRGGEMLRRWWATTPPHNTNH